MPWILVGIGLTIALGLVLQAAASNRIARAIAQLRDIARRDIRHRPLEPKDRMSPDDQARFDALARSLEASGARFFDRVVELHADGSDAGIMQWFVDTEAATCGWFAVLASGRRRVPVVLLFSQSQDGHFIVTRWGMDGMGHLAGPPNLHRPAPESGDDIPAALRRHRECARGAGSGPLVTIPTMSAALALRERLNVVCRAWRTVQPRATLIEADARAMLPGPTASLVPGVVRKLTRWAA